MAISLTNSLFFIFASNFSQISFGGRHIYIINGSTILKNCTFYFLRAPGNIFLIESTEQLVIIQVNFIDLQARALFLCKNLNTFILMDSLFSKFLDVKWVWSVDSTIEILWLNQMNFTELQYTNGVLFFQNKVNIKFENSLFRSMRAIESTIVTFNIYGGNLYVYNCVFNEILGGNMSTSIISLQYSDGIFIKTKFLNVGWSHPFVTQINGYIISDQVSLIWYWNAYESTLIQCEFINNGPYSIFAGFLIFEISLRPIVIKEVKMIVTNHVKDFFYKGIISVESTKVTFENNYFEGLRCSSEEFFEHKNGAIGFFVTPAYARAKNEMSFHGENNTFVGCNCKYGGSLGVINFNTVLIKNFTFLDSFGKIGGAFLIVSSSFVMMDHVRIYNSSANEYGLFKIKNIDNFNMKDCVFRNITT